MKKTLAKDCAYFATRKDAALWRAAHEKCSLAPLQSISDMTAPSERRALRPHGQDDTLTTEGKLSAKATQRLGIKGAGLVVLL